MAHRLTQRKGWLLLLAGLILLLGACSSSSSKSVDAAALDLSSADILAPDLRSDGSTDRSDTASGDLSVEDQLTSADQPDAAELSDIQDVNSTKPTLKAGVATVDITPEIGVPLAGYGGGKRRDFDLDKLLIGLDQNCVDPDPSNPYTMFNPSLGKLDAINAKALIIDNGQRKVLWIGLDTIGVNQELTADVAIAMKPLGIPKENIFVTATHTHSGPGVLSIRRFWEMAAADCFNQKVYDIVKAKVISAAKQALANLTPVEYGINSGIIEGVQRNRRGNTGVFDNMLTVIHLRTPDGKPHSTVVSLPIHPTSLGDSNMMFSADLTGVVERELEKTLGGTAIFVQKPEGDVSAVAPKPGIEGMNLLGATIANRAIELLPTSYVTDLPITTAQLMVDFGLPALAEGCSYPGAFDLCGSMPDFELSLDLTSEWFPQKIPISLMRVGDTLIVGLPGEPTTRVGEMVKDALKEKGETNVLVFALVNEHMGYVTTPEEYEKRGYEAIATLFGKNTANKLVDAVLTTYKELD